MNRGTFYGVSVGPGDPELLTLKAKRIIESCLVIAAPETESGGSAALSIAKGAADLSQKTILPLTFPMTTDETELARSHRREAARIAALLDQGMDVAMLSLGDVSVYSTFGYLCPIIREAGYQTEAIPGVTSFCAAAAALGVSLTAMKTPLHILPFRYADPESSLALGGTKVLMKIGGALPEVKRLLRRKGLLPKASMVVNCGLTGQRVYENIADAADDEGYFATILLRE